MARAMARPIINLPEESMKKRLPSNVKQRTNFINHPSIRAAQLYVARAAQLYVA
jgi:hypothetical protein